MTKPLLVALACTILLAQPANARPRKPAAPETAQQPPEIAEAQRRFKRALELYEEGSLDAARVELRRAYDVAPNYKLLFNLGQIEFELHDYPAALADFQQFLTDGGSNVPPERRTQVERDLEKLGLRVAMVDVSVDVAGADVFVDEVAVGPSPLGKPLVLSAGRRVVSAAKAGFVTAKRVVDLAGGDNAKVELHLADVAAAKVEERPAPIAVAPPARSGAFGVTTSGGVPWFGWGVTGVLAVGAATSGVLALDASRTLRQERGSLGVTRATLDAQQKKVETLSLVADAATGAAVVAFAFSLYATLARKPSPRDEAVGLRLVPTVGGLQVAGKF